MTEMIQKESLSDDALMPFNSMDKYLMNSNNINQMVLQNQNISMHQTNSNCNMNYNGIREGMNEESLRSRTCYNPNLVNQIPFNNPNYPYNRMPMMMNAAPLSGEQLTMQQLYMISNNYQPIDKLTLSVNNGNLVGPFHLPADKMVAEFEFNLTDDSLNQINIRDDLDIVLLSRFTKENALNLLSWPSAIKISVNDSQLSLDMTSYNKIPLHLPQFIKRNCLSGRNVVKFEIFDMPRFNNQLFQFHIYMVHRPTIVHSKKLTLDSAFVCDELTIKLLQDNCRKLNRDYTMISTICPITDKRIEIPIRFRDCEHLQPFDLMGFFKMQARWMLNICPLCRKNMNFNFNGYQQNIVIDHILQRIFEKIPIGCDMIKVDSNLAFTPIFSGPGPEYMPMMAQPNNNNNGMMNALQLQQQQQRQQQFQHMNDPNAGAIMQHMRPMFRYMPVEGPGGQFMNVGPGGGIQSPPVMQQYRPMMNSASAQSMINNRSMLDFNPCDMYGAAGTPLAATNQSPAKKPTKRKPPAKKSASKVATLDPVINNVRNNSGGGHIKSITNVTNCPTPPSTRTSSVASTSSPDSLNVPHSIPKRSPSIDQLSNTILSESHLNDELLLYSSSTNHLNTKSIFSESHLSTSVDELVTVPQMSSSSSFNQSQTFYPQQQQQYNNFPQQKLPGWTVNESQQQLFAQHQQYQQHQQQQHTPVSLIVPVTSVNVTNEQHETIITANQYDDSSTSSFYQDTVTRNSSKYVDDILANHDPVPELDDCDWLDDTYSLVNAEQQIVGLSDVEDF